MNPRHFQPVETSMNLIRRISTGNESLDIYIESRGEVWTNAETLSRVQRDRMINIVEIIADIAGR